MKSQLRTRATTDVPAARRVKVRLTAAQRREHFLEVAGTLIVESGIESVTMERVAERAGVSKALGYGYFQNSDDLLAAVFDRELAELDRQVLGRSAGINDPAARLREIMAATFDVMSRKGPLLGRLLQNRASGGALETKRRERQRFVEDYFAQMMVEEAGVPARQAAVAAAVWQAAVNGAMELWVTRRVSTRELIEVFTRMVMGSVAALTAGGKLSTRPSTRR